MFQSLKGSIANLVSKINLCGGNGQTGLAQVPQKYKLGSRVIQEEKLLSEGGYGYVWEGHDVSTKEKFAIKKMLIQSPEKLALAEKEIDVLRRLPKNQHIVEFYDGVIITFEDRQTKMAILLFELCREGSLLSYIMKHKDTPLDEVTILNILDQIVKALIHLHSQQPPIAHRDLKLENVLINNKTFKLCDFGSCSSARVDFNEVNRKDFYQYEEVYEKNTTLMYRPPEMIEPYLKFSVTEQVDIWMLGCILFILLFYRHPFEDASKLSIVNCAYQIPKIHSYSPKILSLLSVMLTPNPSDRATIYELDIILGKYHETKRLEVPLELQNRAKKPSEPEKKPNATVNPPKKPAHRKVSSSNKQPLMDSSNDWGDFVKAGNPTPTVQKEYMQQDFDFESFAVENKPPGMTQWGSASNFLNAFKVTMPASPRMEDFEERKDPEIPYFSITPRK